MPSKSLSVISIVAILAAIALGVGAWFYHQQSIVLKANTEELKQTKQALDNIGAILKRVGLGYDDVFHCTAMLSDMKLWPDFNKVYVIYFPEGKRPARSAFGASGLALNALVELECQAYAGKQRL